MAFSNSHPPSLRDDGNPLGKSGGETVPDLPVPVSSSHNAQSNSASKSSNSVPPAPNPEKLAKTIKNYENRLNNDLFNLLPLGLLGYDSIHYTRTPLDPNTLTDVQIGSLAVGNLGGLATGYVLHKALLHSGAYNASPEFSLNPLYRTYKTGAATGLVAGTLLTNLISEEYIHVPEAGKKFLIPIISNAISFVMGLLAIPYWLIRQYVLKIVPKENETYHIMSIEGPSKYVKSALVYGTSLGQAIGALISHLLTGGLHAGIVALYGGMVGLGSAVFALVMVPTVNYISQKLGYGKILKVNANECGVDLVPKNQFNDQIKEKARKKKTPVLIRLGPNKFKIYGDPKGDGTYVEAEINFPSEEKTPESAATLLEKLPFNKNAIIEMKNDNKQLIPLLDLLKTHHAQRENKNKFRNNYVRTGITLGIALGSIVGFLIGTLVFPGVGSTLGAMIGAAIGSTLCGPILGILGSRITNWLEDKWNIDPDTNNSWDYAARTDSYAFSSYGIAIAGAIALAVLGTGGGILPVLLSIVPAMMLGNYIASGIGWFAGVANVVFARKIQPEEKDATTLPWSQRVGGDIKRYSLAGLGIGALAGIPLGPAGMLVTATIGNAIGGIFGSIYGTFKDEETRNVIKAIFVKPKPPVVARVAALERERTMTYPLTQEQFDLIQAEIDRIKQQKASSIETESTVPVVLPAETKVADPSTTAAVTFTLAQAQQPQSLKTTTVKPAPVQAIPPTKNDTCLPEKKPGANNQEPIKVSEQSVFRASSNQKTVALPLSQSPRLNSVPTQETIPTLVLASA